MTVASPMKQTVLASPPLSLLKLGRYTRAEAFVPGSAFVGLRFELKATKQIQELSMPQVKPGSGLQMRNGFTYQIHMKHVSSVAGRSEGGGEE